jgi:hypothetical protein
MNPLKYWNSKTFDVTNHRWFLDERKNKTFTTSGSDSSSTNIYTYNSLGFRGDEIPLKNKKLMAIGCSHTEGIGVNNDETWPYYLSKLLNYSHINFGFTGRSNDYISRCVISFVDVINPDFISIMYTYPERIEYYTSNGGIEPYHPNSWGWFAENETEYTSISNISNDYNNFINWYKNHLLISNYLENKNIPFTWNGVFLNTEYTDKNRFDGKYDIEYGKHATPTQNEVYAKSLYEHITKLK